MLSNQAQELYAKVLYVFITKYGEPVAVDASAILLEEMYDLFTLCAEELESVNEAYSFPIGNGWWLPGEDGQVLILLADVGYHEKTAKNNSMNRRWHEKQAHCAGKYSRPQ